ncbi:MULTISPECIES: hypothetical protein [Sphingobium]|uniref:hypothetical protein n=1 Tax=Sphingobium TaxID=165695 RepID=UPI00159C7E85|nr:hypothetical protein [Sphingobium sp. 15-1]
MNVVNLTGRVAKDPEIRNNVTTLIVATDRVKLKDGKTRYGCEIIADKMDFF